MTVPVAAGVPILPPSAARRILAIKRVAVAALAVPGLTEVHLRHLAIGAFSRWWRHRLQYPTVRIHWLKKTDRETGINRQLSIYGDSKQAGDWGYQLPAC